MNEIINDFLKKSINSGNITCYELLESARTVANFIKDFEFAKYCEKEINGYNSKDSVPAYRKIKVTYETWAMGHSTGISIFPAPGEGEDSIPKKPLYCMCKNTWDSVATQPIVDIEKKIQGNHNVVSDFFNFPGDPLKNSTKHRTSIELSHYKGIVQGIRNKINDWKNQMIAQGTFTMDQINSTSNITIINKDGQNINNIGSNSGSITQTTTNNSNNIDFEALKQLITKIETDLENAKNIEAEKADSLKEQIASLKKFVEEQNETSTMDLLKNIATGAISSGIWSIGSTITTFLSSLPPFT